MSNTGKRKNKRAGKEDDLPTASFTGSARGPGSQIGPFRIERELGRGAVGVIYLVHDAKLDREVAINYSLNWFEELKCLVPPGKE